MDAIRDSIETRIGCWASRTMMAGIFADMMLPLFRRDFRMKEMASAALPPELMMHVASCIESNSDKQSLRMLNRQWKAAVDESIIRLSGNMYTICDKDLERLAAFSQLQSLDLSQCRALIDLRGLARLPQLRSLELNCCMGLKGGALSALAQLPQLQKLDLCGCSALTDDCMEHITGLLKLVWLSLQGCTGLSAAGLSQLKHCKRLQYLDLSGTRVVGLGFLEIRNTSLDFAGPKEAWPHRPGRVICIQADCSSGAVAADVKAYSKAACSELKRLRLADCECLAESALCSLTGLAELETLDFSRSTQALTDSAVAALQKLAGLTRLNLEGSPDLCDATLLKLTTLQGLTHLDVSECPNLSPGALSTLRHRIPSTCAIYSATS